MKDFVSVLNAFTGKGGRTAYSVVNTNEGNENVYIPTTAPNQPNENPAHRKSQSLNPSAAVFDRFFHGNFGERNQRKWMFLTLVCGLFAVSFGSLLLALNPYDVLFKMKVRFSEGSETFELWRQPPVKLYLKVYLFNITNKEDFLSGKVDKLKFEEIGPYVYSEHMSHENVSFNNNGTMSAIPSHPLTYIPELSNGTEEDLVIMPNIAMLSIAHVERESWTRFMLNLFIRSRNAEYLVEMTAKEFMFGYKSTILSLGNTFLPSWITFDKLGLIDRMYNFEGDTSTTYTGMTDIRLSGLLENYNGLSHLPQWDSEPCNNITGASDGTKFPSYIKPNDTLFFFRKSLCRRMPLVKVGEEFVGGLPGYLYHFQNNSLDNGVYDEDNKCYCREGNCLSDGLVDVTNCYYGFPIALSYPHFMDGNPSFINGVEGMHPDPERHTTYFVVNPTSGLPLKLSVKMQINMALGNLDKVAGGSRFSGMVLPMLWTEIAFDGLPQNILTRFYLYLKVAPIAQTISIYLFLIGGVAFILLSLASAVCIPKDLKLSQNSNTWRDDTLTQEKIVKEKNKHRLKETTKDSKEMEVYYCSLLTPNIKDDEVDRLSSFEEL